MAADCRPQAADKSTETNIEPRRTVDQLSRPEQFAETLDSARHGEDQGDAPVLTSVRIVFRSCRPAPTALIRCARSRPDRPRRRQMSKPQYRGRTYLASSSRRPSGHRRRRRGVGAAFLGCRRRGRPALPALLAACGGSGDASSSGTGGGSADRHRDLRLQPVRRRAEEGLRRRRSPRSRPTAGADGQGQHRRPQHVPGEDQQLPAGQPGRRVHLVRRLPDAVLRRARASPATSATCGTRSAATSPTPSRRRPPATTASSTSCRSTTTRGRVLLPQERVRRQGLPGPQDAGRADDARRADEEGRPRPRSPSPTRTAGRRWARSTSSTCASTATTSTSA